MTHPQLVRVPTVGKNKTSLSKGQKEFNQLVRKVEDLETELAQFQAATTAVQQRIRTEYEPLLRQYNQHRAQLVRLFDRAYEHDQMTKTERKKLVDLILPLIYELVQEHAMDELKPIAAKYSADTIEVNTTDSATNWHEQNEPKQPESHQQAQRSKTVKQRTRADRKQLERSTTKAIRALYMDLVKAFHPDRELDEAEKSRKTDLMQRVTQAYGTNNLLTLLRLQLEFNQVDEQPLETLANKQLNDYNNLLRQQADELSTKLYDLRCQLAATLRKPLKHVNSVLALEFSFNDNLRALERAVKAIKKEVKYLADPLQMKAFLKTY